MKPEIYKCSLCNYESYKKYNFNRHMITKHNDIDNKNVIIDNKNVIIDNKNVIIDNKCSKCNKILSSKQYLQKHLLICKGVSNPLECHICHKIYVCRSSKSRHIKTCREKMQELVIIPEEQQLQTIQSNQQIEIIPQIINNTQIVNNTNCNNTYNLNLIRFNEDELKIDFDIKHLETNNIIHKLYIIQPEDAFRVFYKKLFQNKNNQMTIKENLKHTYSKVHTGRNIWQKMLDDYIYHIIMHFISETLLSYIYNYTKNKEDYKYKRLREYADYMATKGYSCNNTKEIEKSYKNHIKSLKYLFNSFKDD